MQSTQRAITLFFFDRLNDLEQLPASIVQCKSLGFVDLSGTKVTDLRPLLRLPRLRYLCLSATPIDDLDSIAPITMLTALECDNTKIQTLNGLHRMHFLRRLSIRNTGVTSLKPLTLSQQLVDLDIHNTKIADLSPIRKCLNLRNLVISGTDVSDLSHVRYFRNLRKLDLSGTMVSNLNPIADILSLMYSARPGHGTTGLSYRNTPLSRDEPYSNLIRLPNPARTVETINLVRRQNGLEEHVPPGYVRVTEVPPRPATFNPDSDLEPVENVPAPLDFKVSPDGRIALAASAATIPVFPQKGNKRDHKERLQACRTLAEDLIFDLASTNYQVRVDYRDTLAKYASRLPRTTARGNILLADAQARTLRSLFAAEMDFLSPGFASKLKTMLEHHIGLRVYYPGLTEFYRDVQSGRIDQVLPLDAVEGFVRTVKESTPNIFEPSVAEAIEGTAATPYILPKTIEEVPRQTETEQPFPPRDPLGELDPYKARDFSIAGSANALWKIVLQGDRLNKAIEGWSRLRERLGPDVGRILRWLREFMNNGDGGPPNPPGISA